MAATTLRAALAEVLPTADSADNANMSDVIGNKTDTSSGDSLMAFAKVFDDHIHMPAKCYPTLANGILVTGGVGAWTLGNAISVVPINTITSEFDIHHIEVEAASANDIYELFFYSDAAATVFIGHVRTSKQSNQTGATSAPIQTSRVAANGGVWAKLASKTGGDNLTISLFYHEY